MFLFLPKVDDRRLFELDPGKIYLILQALSLLVILAAR